MARQFGIYSSSGVLKCYPFGGAITYSGERMADEFVYMTVKSPVAINFEVGDYCIYRGEKFYLNSIPGCKKNSRPGTNGESFVYESVKLYPASYELRRLQMRDVVFKDNNLVTLMPNFSFYASDVKVLADRIKANLDREYTGENKWTVKVLCKSTEPDGHGEYKTCHYLGGVGWDSDWDPNYDYEAVGEKNVNVSVSSQYVWDVLSTETSKSFKVNFIVRGRTINIGSEGILYSKYFGHESLMYGLNNGASSVQAIPEESSENIITRLYAYGNTTNMPERYYQRSNAEYYGLFKYSIALSNGYYAAAIRGEYANYISVGAFTSEVTETNELVTALKTLSGAEHIYASKIRYNNSIYEVYVTNDVTSDQGYTYVVPTVAANKELFKSFESQFLHEYKFNVSWKGKRIRDIENVAEVEPIQGGSASKSESGTLYARASINLRYYNAVWGTSDNNILRFTRDDNTGDAPSVGSLVLWDVKLSDDVLEPASFYVKSANIKEDPYKITLFARQYVLNGIYGDCFENVPSVITLGNKDYDAEYAGGSFSIQTTDSIQTASQISNISSDNFDATKVQLYNETVVCQFYEYSDGYVAAFATGGGGSAPYRTKWAIPGTVIRRQEGFNVVEASFLIQDGVCRLESNGEVVTNHEDLFKAAISGTISRTQYNGGYFIGSMEDKIVKIDDSVDSEYKEIVFTAGINTFWWPVSWSRVPEGYILPDSINVRNLMLPGFPDVPLSEYLTKDYEVNTLGVSVASTDNYRIRIQTDTDLAKKLGLADGDTIGLADRSESGRVLQFVYNEGGEYPYEAKATTLEQRDLWFNAGSTVVVSSREPHIVTEVTSKLVVADFRMYLSLPYNKTYCKDSIVVKSVLGGNTYRLYYDDIADNWKLESDAASTHDVLEITDDLKGGVDVVYGVNAYLVPNAYRHETAGKQSDVIGSSVSNDPYIESENRQRIGLYEQCVTFDGSVDGYDDIYPTIKDITAKYIRDAGYVLPEQQPNGDYSDNDYLDTVAEGSDIQDNGIFTALDEDTTEEAKDERFFTIKIKRLGFDLEEAKRKSNDTMSIQFTDGLCGGREFSVDRIDEGEVYTTIRLARKEDEDLNRYFPYAGYNIERGDKFVILNMPLPDMYIDAASARLLDAAKKYLAEHDYRITSYSLDVSSIYMQRQHDSHELNEEISLHDTIKAGDFIVFSDADLIPGYEPEASSGKLEIVIDKVEIKEGEEQLPSYTITLRENKKLTKWERVERDVTRNATSVVISEGMKAFATPSYVRSEVSRAFGDDEQRNVDLTSEQTVRGKKHFEDGITSDSIDAGTVNAGSVNVSGDETVSGNMSVKGTTSVKNLNVEGSVSSGSNNPGMDGDGWKIDRLGNAEFQSARIRSYLEVIELLINRQRAQEGDTIFSDNDQIDKVERIVDETDNSVSYILSLKEKYSGYVTAQMYGNILVGVINTLAAKGAGISDESQNNPNKQGVDDGGNLYYTSWMRVIGTHATSNILGVNQIQVVLYGDNEVPAQKNFEPCELMVIARRGCIDYSDPDDPDYETIKESIVRRQRVFVISTSDGRVVKYTGVDRPIMKNGNYGVTIGELPEFVKDYPRVREVLNQVGEHTDWLYAQGVVVGNYIKVDREGLPVPQIVYCGDWIDGGASRSPITIQVWDAATQQYVSHTLTYPIPAVEYTKDDSFYIGYGIYFYNRWNARTQQYETHEVRHNGGRWQCLQSQPVISGGTATFNEPHWNSSYWILSDGNDNLTIEFVSSNGYSFRRGSVDTVVTPHLFYGNVDISNDVAAEYWNWTRESESGKTAADVSWDAQHTGLVTGVKTLHLTDAEMPQSWSLRNKAIFTLTVTVNDGRNTRIVDNQIIS